MRDALALPLVFVAASALGCGGQKGDGDRPAGPLAAATTLIERPRTAAEENGLEIVRWSVADRENVIRRAMARHADSSSRRRMDVVALEQAGLRAVIVRDEHLPSLLADFGGTTTAVATWYGQVPQWREAARASILAPQPVMVEGRAEQFAVGWLRLMVRGWTVELEDGGRFELQVVPQWVRETPELSSLTNRDQLRGRIFAGASIAVELERNTSLVLLAAPPSTAEEEDPEGPPSAARSESRRGPPVVLPPTPGELLLVDVAARPPRRIVLLFRARLPDTLFPSNASSNPSADQSDLPPLP